MKGRESQCSVYYCIFFLIPLLSLLFSSLLYSPFPFPVIYLVFPFFFSLPLFFFVFASCFFSALTPLYFLTFPCSPYSSFFLLLTPFSLPNMHLPSLYLFSAPPSTSFSVSSKLLYIILTLPTNSLLSPVSHFPSLPSLYLPLYLFSATPSTFRFLP